MSNSKADVKKQQAGLVGARIKMTRKSAGLSLQEVADRLNRDFGASVNRGMLSKYENGIHEPSAGTVYCLSGIFGVSADYLMCRTDLPKEADDSSSTDETGHAIQIYSRYNPTDGGETENGVVELIPSGWLTGGHEFFGLRISGSKLAPRYYDGDIVIFERRGKVPGDRVALVSIGGGDAFLCHLIRKRTGKEIIPIDRMKDSMFFTTEQIEKSEIHIIGSAVQVRRME